MLTGGPKTPAYNFVHSRVEVYDITRLRSVVENRTAALEAV
jgi:hypothetical protein